MDEVPLWTAVLWGVAGALAAIIVGHFRKQVALRRLEVDREKIDVDEEKVDIDRLRIATDVLVEIVDGQRKEMERLQLRWEKERERLERERDHAIAEGREVKANLEAQIEECNKHIAQLEDLQRRLNGGR